MIRTCTWLTRGGTVCDSPEGVRYVTHPRWYGTWLTRGGTVRDSPEGVRYVTHPRGYGTWLTRGGTVRDSPEGVRYVTHPRGYGTWLTRGGTVRDSPEGVRYVTHPRGYGTWLTRGGTVRDSPEVVRYVTHPRWYGTWLTRGGTVRDSPEVVRYVTHPRWYGTWLIQSERTTTRPKEDVRFIITHRLNNVLCTKLEMRRGVGKRGISHFDHMTKHLMRRYITYACMYLHPPGWHLLNYYGCHTKMYASHMLHWTGIQNWQGTGNRGTRERARATESDTRTR